MRKNRIYTDIYLDGIHSSGRCHAHLGGKHLFTDLGIPGEIVNVTDVRHEADYLRGKVIHQKNASSSRVVPGCKHYGICGGCNWQHIGYEAQLFLKRDILADALKKQGIDHPGISLPAASPELHGFRHRLDYSFSARRWYYEGEGKVEEAEARLALGFHPEGNPFKTVDIEECFMQAPPSRDICARVKEFTLRNGYSYHDPKENTGLLRALSIRMNRKNEVMVVVTFREDDPYRIRNLMQFMTDSFAGIRSLWWAVVPEPENTWADAELVHWLGTDEYLMEEANGIRFRISPRSFYQPNPEQAERIFSRIRELAGLKGTELVYDLYSGIGTIALTLARDAARVIGIEGNPDAVKDALFNAEENGFPNAHFVNGDILATFTPDFVAKNGKPDVIVLDPPRSGTLIEIKKNILLSAPSKIIYLSCNPLSLAKDLKMLTGDYSISLVEPFDQFPHTHHLETLVLLEKR